MHNLGRTMIPRIKERRCVSTSCHVQGALFPMVWQKSRQTISVPTCPSPDRSQQAPKARSPPLKEPFQFSSWARLCSHPWSKRLPQTYPFSRLLSGWLWHGVSAILFSAHYFHFLAKGSLSLIKVLFIRTMCICILLGAFYLKSCGIATANLSDGIKHEEQPEFGGSGCLFH